MVASCAADLEVVRVACAAVCVCLYVVYLCAVECSTVLVVESYSAIWTAFDAGVDCVLDDLGADVLPLGCACA